MDDFPDIGAFKVQYNAIRPLLSLHQLTEFPGVVGFTAVIAEKLDIALNTRHLCRCVRLHQQLLAIAVTVGYDRLASLLNSAHRLEQGSSFPPYNIQKAGEDRYRITMAVAGFAESDLKIISEDNKLLVTGDRPDEDNSEENVEENS